MLFLLSRWIRIGNIVMREGDDGDGGFRARKLSMSRLRYGR